MSSNLTGLQEDLNRTRRLVSAMRGIIQASSAHHAVLGDIEMYGEKKHKKLETKVFSNRTPLSPRARYLREYQEQQVRLIQRQWKQTRKQKSVQATLVIKRKYRSRIGVWRYKHAAAEIQRIFRGFLVRSHTGEDLVKWFRRTQENPHYHTPGYQRFLRLREERLKYFASWSQTVEELEQSHKYIAKLEKTQVHTHHKVLAQIQLDQRQEPHHFVESGEASSPSVVLIFVDTDLLDGINSRVEAQRLLKYIHSELVKTKLNIQMQQKTLQFIQTDHPLRHHAATRIAARFKTFLALQQLKQLKKKKKEKQFRILLSKHNCYKRMNAGLVQRQLQRAHVFATTIQSFWRMILAKRFLFLLQKQKAARYILQFYRASCQVPLACQRLKWLSIKHQAQKWRQIQVHHHLRDKWKGWWQVVLLEKKRQAQIQQALQKGQEKWITRIILWVQQKYRLIFKKKLVFSIFLQEKIDPKLELYLKKNKNSQEQEKNFFDQIQADFRCFQAQFDDKINRFNQHFHFLANRYQNFFEQTKNIEFQQFPIKQMWTWYHQLTTKCFQQKVIFFYFDKKNHQFTLKNFPMRTLKMLFELNTFYCYANHFSIQRHKILSLYESKMVIRDYIKLLFAFDRIDDEIFFQISTTTNSRQLAIQKLDQIIHLEKFTSMGLESFVLFGPILENGHEFDGESLALAGNNRFTSSILRTESCQSSSKKKTIESGRCLNFHTVAQQRRILAATNVRTSVSLEQEFSFFHSVLSDLCEKCLVLRPRRLNGIQIQNNITCNVCGHANYARQTVSCSISRKTFLRSDLKNSFSQKKKWFHPDERCDFLILNVFFHAFAPFGHMNRIAYEVESIWKIAMTNALPFINALYERNCCTLNDLIYEFNNKGQENDSSSIWTLLPVPVSRKLHQFLRILQEEMINLVPTNKQ